MDAKTDQIGTSQNKNPSEFEMTKKENDWFEIITYSIGIGVFLAIMITLGLLF